MNYATSIATVSVQETIEPEVQGVWVGLGYDAATISWPNVKFTPPRDDFWLESVMNFGESQPFIFYGAGQGINQKTAILILTVRGPKTVGLRSYYVAADAVIAHFTRKHFGGVYTEISDGPVNLSEEAFAAVQVAIILRYYESAG